MATREISLQQLKDMTGQEVGVSDWFEVTQEVIQGFAEVTRDYQWIHVNPDRARRESQFGVPIAHGFLTLSLVSHLAHRAVEVRHGMKMTVNYGLNRVRFVSPVPAGSKIRARLSPQNVGDDQIHWLVTMDLQGSEKPALVAEWIVRFY